MSIIIAKIVLACKFMLPDEAVNKTIFTFDVFVIIFSCLVMIYSGMGPTIFKGTPWDDINFRF